LFSFYRFFITQIAGACAFCVLVCLPGIHLSSGQLLGKPDDSSSVNIQGAFLPDGSQEPDSAVSTDSSSGVPVLEERSIVVPAVPEPVLDSLAHADTVSVPGPGAEDSLGADSTRLSLEIEPGFNLLALRYNGIYLNAGTAGDSSRIEELIERCRGTPVSGFVIDMKDDQGYLSYRSNNPLASQVGSNTRRVGDPAALVQHLHDSGLIACARVVAFKDPLLSTYSENDAYPYAVLDSATGFPWRQNNGETWANPQDNRVHDYLIAVVEELVSFGFDQIQLDYLRFPSDSSHFPESFKAEYGPLRAYHIVREGTEKAAMRKGSHRTGVQPYIQGFRWQEPHFGTDYFLQQMQAATEGGAVGWIVWNAKNDYSALWEALSAKSLSSQAKTGQR